MREIKFRAWHTKAKQMIFDRWHGECLKFLEEGQPVELMQYTGLKDKNDKEIFEGDILREDNFDLPIWVVWACARFCIVSTAGSHENYIPANVEVVGNIYKNPELLGEDK